MFSLNSTLRESAITKKTLKHTQTSTNMSVREGETTRRTTYVGNSQQMLRDIRQSLMHLRRQPEQRQEPPRISQQSAAAPSSNAATTVVQESTTQANATRPIAHNQNRRGMSHAKALAEIRSSLKPFETTESGYSSCSESGESINKQYLMSQLKAMGLDEVCISESSFCILTRFCCLSSFAAFCRCFVSLCMLHVYIHYARVLHVYLHRSSFTGLQR